MPLAANQARAIRISLWVAYGVAAALAALGTYRGWLFKSHTSGADPTVIVLIALIVGTMLAERGGAFGDRAGWTNLLKAAAFWAAAITWVVLAASRVANTAAGTTLAFGPMYALLLAGLFQFIRFGARRAPWWSAALTRSLQTSAPLPSVTPGPAPMVDLSASPGEAPGRIDIAFNRMACVVRIGVFLALIAVMAPAMYLLTRSMLEPIVIGAVAALGLAWFLWTLSAVGPALSLGSAGLSIRRGLSGIRQLAWHEISGFELRTAGLYAFLVVQVRDGESLIARQGVLGQWIMRQSQKTFGSPVRIPTAWLKCDRNWLLHTANSMLATYGQQAAP